MTPTPAPDLNPITTPVIPISTPTIKPDLNNNVNLAPTPKPSFHFNWGKALGLALLGLEVFREVEAPGSNVSSTLEDPQNIIKILSGVSSIYTQGVN